jgi:hypothetical protein
MRISGGVVAIAIDDFRTIALWHMDSISAGKVLDDCSANPARHNDLTLYNGLTVTSGSSGKYGEALSLDGVDDYAVAAINWASQNSVKVDLWFKASRATGTQNIITAVNTWDIRLEDGAVKFYAWDNAGSAHDIELTNIVTIGVWQHCTASMDASGNMTLTVDDSTASLSTNTIKNQSAPINIGNKVGYSRYFQGLIDEVKITIPSIPSPSCGYWGYYKGDLNLDCHVDMQDIEIASQAWLACSTYGDPLCVQP